MPASIGEQEPKKDWRKRRVEFSPDLRSKEFKAESENPRALRREGLVWRP